jgi:DNA-binding NarL/FixJ family response regulator
LDDTTAVIPIDPHASPLEGAWVIRDATAVAQVAVQLAVLIAESRPYASTERPSLELTAREVRVVQLLSAGMTDEAIARRLGIADRTVRRSVAELLKKVGAESRFGLAIECARRGLV